MFTNIKNFVNDSFFMNNIDNIAYIALLSVLFGAVIFPSELMGMCSLMFSALVLFKTIFKTNFKFCLEAHEKAILIFFLIVTVSLFSSTLFSLSLHGYIKTLIYIIFYFSAALFFKDNKNKVFPTFLFVVGLMSYESIIAIMQNSSGVKEISGWQDMTNLNPEEIVSRAYGTLKPYNPNLLAGYLLCGLASFIYLILVFLKNNKKLLAITSLFLLFINLIAIIDTGCRGAYLGFILFFPALFIALILYIKKRFGALSNIKKRYKNIALALIAALFAFVVTNPAIIKRFQSIFAFRADSSISFRMNVYESVWRMFLDNFFLGIGVGNQNFREIYGLYMKTGFDALGSYCVPLEIAVESGIFALIAFVIFIVYAFKKCFRIFRGDDDNAKIVCLCVCLMLCAIIGHGFFDTIWFRPQVQLLFWVYIAILKTVDVQKQISSAQNN